MDLIQFIEELEQLVIIIDEIIENTDRNIENGIEKMNSLIEGVKKIMPKWTYFIQETQIGKVEDLFTILDDINNGIEATDDVLLLDSLEYGLKSMVLEYISIIKEALDDE